MQRWLFFRQNRPFNWADLETDPAVNTGGKIDPVPVCSFGIFARAFVDASYRTSVNAICYTLANISHNGMGHGVLSLDISTHLILVETGI